MFVGLDIGSVAVKAVALRDGRPARWLVEPTSPDIAAQCRRLLAALGPAEAVCSTGYGRNLAPDADLRVSEILANATGALWLCERWADPAALFGESPEPPQPPGAPRTVVDVGGQDSKVIALDADGLVRDFAMNDRCAAGTGRFLEVMARALGVDLPGLDALAAAADRPAPITSACTVFAESEIVSLLAEGVEAARVAAGVFESIADQVVVLAERCTWEAPVVFDGGASQSRALRRALAARFGRELVVPPRAQLVTALGAALTAARA